MALRSGRQVAQAIEEVTLRSWWVIVFLLVSYFVFERAVYWHHREYETFAVRLYSLESERARCLLRQEELRLQVFSQSDPDWIELTLIRRLGVVPEGETKVYFSNPPSAG